MTVLVTGGMGFIGSYVVRALLAEETDSVVTLDIDVEHNQAQQILRPEELKSVTRLEGDASNALVLTRAARAHGVRHIIHLAHAVDRTHADPAGELVANVSAFVNVLEVARVLHLERVVWASSTAVFGSPRSHRGVVGNDAPHYPRNPYGAYKSLNERVAEHYSATLSVDSVGLRFNYVYGHGRRYVDGLPNPDVGLFAGPARGQRLQVPCADEVVMWQHVEDAAGGVLAALRTTRPRSARAYNTCGVLGSPRQIAALVKSHIPQAEFDFLPGTLDFVHDVDDSLSVQELGYEGRVSLEAGVLQTLRGLGAQV